MAEGKSEVTTPARPIIVRYMNDLSIILSYVFVCKLDVLVLWPLNVIKYADTFSLLTFNAGINVSKVHHFDTPT
jgi:hypothetical protein